jgi:hypothetical protein
VVGRYLIKQPDGRLAIYSEGVESWVQQDLTVEDYVSYCVGLAVREAERDARLRAAEVLDANCDLAMSLSFAEANATAKANGHEVLPGPLDEKLYAEMMDQRGDC